MGGGGGGEEGEFGFQIAPMVDVVFVLLLFFMAIAGQNVTEGYLAIAMPSDGKPMEGKKAPPIVIDIEANGNVSANGKQMGDNTNEREIPILTEWLTAIISADPENPVIIRPSGEAKHERVIDVLNSCRKANVKNLAFG